jgi:protein SCO1/2
MMAFGVSLLGVLSVLVAGVAAEPPPVHHQMRGMVLTVDAAHRSVVISHDSIPGVMPAMTMPFDVRDAAELKGLVPGAIVTFTLVVGTQRAHIERVQIVRYESVERDPITARRLRLLQNMTRSPAPPLTVGEPAPDFSLIDQARSRVALSQFRGKVVALNFIYTSCVLPQFCYRLASHFGVVQKRFKARMGRDLVLLTISFDPVRDTPERLAEYARQWDATPAVWHFLTGTPADIERICRVFGVDAFPDEGLFIHSPRTVVISRSGTVAASIDGNQYTSAQLGDLIGAELDR